MALPPLPRHYIQPKSVWNDKKGRTIICMDIWENQKGYTIELLVLFGEKQIDFQVLPWEKIYDAIQSGKWTRNFTEEFKYLKSKAKS